MDSKDKAIIRQALEELNISPVLDDNRLGYLEIQVSPDYRKLRDEAFAILDKEEEK